MTKPNTQPEALDIVNLTGVQACGRFLHWLFGEDWKDVACCAAVPGTGWYGSDVKSVRKHIEQGTSDLYYSVGVFPAGEVSPRKKDRVVGVAGLVMDDVGTKGSGSALGVFETMVGAKIETSSGNFHWVIKYAERLSGQRELDLHVLSVNALAELGLADRISDITRYARLPWGVNSKPGRGNWSVRMTEFYPDHRGFQQVEVVASILEEMGQDGTDVARNMWDEGTGRVSDWPEDLWVQVRDFLTEKTKTKGSELGVSGGAGTYELTANAGDPDPWLRLQIEIADRLGWPAPEDLGGGVVDCVCPFHEEHTSDDLIRYLGRGNWKCHHTSCGGAGRNNGHYKRKLCEWWDTQCRREGDPVGRVLVAKWEFERAGAVPSELVDSVWAVSEREGAEGAGTGGAGGGGRGAEGVDALLERYVLVSEGGGGQPGWWDLEGEVLISGSQLEARRDVLEVFPAGVGGKKAARHVLANEPGVQTADALGHEPGVRGVYVCPQTGVRRVSTWRGSDYQPVVGMPTVFLEHLDYLVGPAGTYERDELERHMAWVVRNPTKKAARTVILLGGEGVGKDLVVDCFSEVLGRHNVDHVGADQLVGTFNGWQTKRLVVLSELDAGQRYSVANVLKRLTASGSGYATINEKYQRPYMARDVAQFWMTANEMDSLPISENSRRDLVIRCPDMPHKDGEAYYQRVAPALKYDAAEIGRVMWYLQSQVSLAGYDPDKPVGQSEIKTILSRASHSDGVLEFIEGLEALGISADGLEGVTDPTKALIPSTVIRKGLEHRAGIKHAAGRSRALGKAMTAMGWVRTGKRVRDNHGDRVWFWAKKEALSDVPMGNDDISTQARKNKFAEAEAAIMKIPVELNLSDLT